MSQRVTRGSILLVSAYGMPGTMTSASRCTTSGNGSRSASTTP
jgi:hypothetical protein